MHFALIPTIFSGVSRGYTMVQVICSTFFSVILITTSILWQLFNDCLYIVATFLMTTSILWQLFNDHHSIVATF